MSARDLARAIVNSGWGLLEMRPTRVSLEDVFLSLTTSDEQPILPSETVATASEDAAHA